jgi:hypothetical protein
MMLRPEAGKELQRLTHKSTHLLQFARNGNCFGVIGQITLIFPLGQASVTPLVRRQGRQQAPARATSRCQSPTRQVAWRPGGTSPEGSTQVKQASAKAGYPERDGFVKQG